MQVFIALSLAFLAAWIVYWRRPEGSGTRKLPPGPPHLPILGNMLQLGQNPHKSFAHLAQTYGPLMSLKLGNQFAVVASSPEMARELLQGHGLVFSRPFTPTGVCVLDHDHFSMPMLPAASDRWKRLRRVTRENLFSHQALQATQSLRQGMLRKLIDYIGSCSGEGRAMNVGEATFTTTFNLMFTTFFSIELMQYDDWDSGSGTNRKLKEHVNAIVRYIGVPNIADFFPIFARFDPQGLRRKLTYHLGSLLELVQSLIDERLRARTTPAYRKKDDFLETLLDIVEGKDEYGSRIKEFKHLFVDLIIAGSHTTAATSEWAMVELLLHPEKMGKLKAELKSVIGDKTIVEESEISKLPYFQATINEVFRFHPAAPLLSPHVAEEEAQVNGYKIPKNTTMFVNMWAIARDPSIWKNPEDFEPERFLGNNINFEGRNFELIPFGSGRRMCPGMPLVSRMLPCMVATMCHNFDWKFEKGVESKQLQREEVFGLALQKKTPLLAIPIKDLIIAGSHTTAATSEWAMVELLLHPEKMGKLKVELKSVIGDKTIVEESEISKLPYFQATINEVFRYHPAAPLLSPHVAEEEAQVNGYKIPKNTTMFVNMWAIARDPSIWKNPEDFEPERFLGNNINFEGKNFELIPFGSGRRMCPGMPLVSRMLPCMVATMCHNFDWKFEKGVESKQLQREEVFGLALQKKTHLLAIPIKV